MTARRLIEPARLAGSSLLRTQSDARLVDLVRAGHAAAFEAIVQRYRGPLLGYCRRLLPASRAEDAVQRALMQAYEAMVSGEAELNLRPWLYRIAHNSSLNLLRENGWSYEQLAEHLDGVPAPDQVLELRERLRSTVDAVKGLPERQRDAVLLREVDGLSYEEIALALGVGDGAVRQLLHRARRALRSGATALIPAGLVERLAAGLQGSGDPATRAVELAAGMGLGTGAVKLGAAVLATGAIATGALSGSLSHRDRHDPHGSAADAAIPLAAVPRAEAAESDRASNGSPAGDDRGHSRGGPMEDGSHQRRELGHAGSGSDERPSSADRRGPSGGGSDGRTSSEPDGSSGRSGSGDGSTSGSGGPSGETSAREEIAPDGGTGPGPSGSTGTGAGDDAQPLAAPTTTTETSGVSGKESGSSGSAAQPAGPAPTG